MNGLVVLLWSAAVALVLIVIGIFLSLLMMGRISLFPAADDTGQTPGVVAKIDTTYRVLVLNATSDPELTAEVRSALMAEGWAEDSVIGTEGATAQFDTTTVFYVEKADEAAALGLADLLDGADVEQSDAYAELDATAEPQLTVVIGTDRANGGAEPTEEPAQ